jgi:hypothetical protein
VIRDNRLRYAAFDEAEFNEIAAGKLGVPGVGWPDGPRLNRGAQGSIGVVWTEREGPVSSARPVLIVVGETDQRRLFGRFSQVRSDLSPLSAWCHIVTPEQFERVHSADIEPDLQGFEACWTGLAIAEAAILAGRPLASLKVTACLATQSYAIGRTFALWGARSVSSVLDVFDNAQKGLRQRDSALQGIRESFTPIWSVLSGVLGARGPSNRDEEDIVVAVRSLLRAKSMGLAPELVILEEFGGLEAAEFLRKLDSMSPEQRLRQFDKIVDALADVRSSPGELTKLSFLAGFLATVAAGGASSLKLAESVSNRYPQITAWAYVIGGIGEPITWSSGFEGLGRMVSRELERPFHISEPPTCDFSVSEASVLIDRQLSDPLVHLRIKQLRTVAVSLFPGVNIVIPLHDQFVESQRAQSPVSGSYRARNEPLIENIAAAIMPSLIPHIENYLKNYTNRKESPKGGRKSSQRKLPLE